MAAMPRIGLESWLVAARMDYVKDPRAIHRASFEIIEREAALDGFSGPARALAVRVVHACGMIDAIRDLVLSPGAAELGVRVLRGGAAIIADAEMVASGIVRSRLPAGNPVLCGLRETKRDGGARVVGNTRSAAGIDLLRHRLGGSVVAIGNAPTALFRLLELIDEGAPKPAMILGFPGLRRGRGEQAGLGRRRPRRVLRDSFGTQGRQRHGGGGGQCLGRS